MSERKFHAAQAQELAHAFAQAGVEYLFLGKGGAIILGYPGTTQDVDVFAPRSAVNGRRILTALQNLEFPIDAKLAAEIIANRDFIQIKSGPFDLDIIHAPDGIPDFETARARSVTTGVFHVANLRDIIASKKASGRRKDLVELPLLESFRQEYEKLNPQPLRSAAEIAAERKRTTDSK